MKKNIEDKVDGMLSPYRALDLSGEMGLMCGKLLGDLGADVIKIERPGGDPARNIGPFYHDEPDHEKSLFWFAYNANKRGITLDIETSDGQEIFEKLVKSADWVIETFPPGYMDKISLGYGALEKINPRIILVSITPFGQTGPYKDYKAPDIVAWAMGGAMYAWGDADHGPVRISHHSHAYMHAAGEAAVGALMALYHREMNGGEGQWVNISVQQSVLRTAGTPLGVTSPWDMAKINNHLRWQLSPGVRIRNTYACKDGFVRGIIRPWPRARDFQIPIIKWMASEGMTDDFLLGFDWEKFDLAKTSQDVVDHIEGAIAKFFMSHTKAELYEGAIKNKIWIYPLSTTKEVMESTQLAARKFWVDLEHPELDTSITYPGAFACSSEAPPKISRRAPLIGEHNKEIYEKELGVPKHELVILKQNGII